MTATVKVQPSPQRRMEVKANPNLYVVKPTALLNRNCKLWFFRTRSECRRLLFGKQPREPNSPEAALVVLAANRKRKPIFWSRTAGGVLLGIRLLSPEYESPVRTWIG